MRRGLKLATLAVLAASAAAGNSNEALNKMAVTLEEGADDKICCPKNWDPKWGLGPLCRDCPEDSEKEESLNRLESKVETLSLLVKEKAAKKLTTTGYAAVAAGLIASAVAGLLVSLRISSTRTNEAEEFERPFLHA
eukprot:TRINITY_DN55428_c0_g1_i1.p1 TRINITY_DN55428_c0_g1~~TRINITY_DN55428_c0_g1_i1.p1  ORF type:complete len:137 (-),score=36.98 TRINITY_DN55428_c0_g1_i1:81-491(-)